MIRKNEEIAKIAKEKLNKVIIVETKRKDGSLRIQQDFTNCPTLTEQHSAHISDLNYLIEKYKPDELAAYMAARNQYRREIIGHDFSKEPSLQEAKNIILASQQEFDALPEEIKNNFRNQLEFIKFIDNPENAQRMIKMGLLTKEQIQTLALEKKDESKSEEKKDELKKE